MGRVGTNVLSTNFQIKLHETSQVVEVVYGNISLNIGSNTSVQLGLRGINNSVFNNRSSSNSNWNATVAGTNASANIIYNGGSNPSSGQTYTFTPPPPCSVPNVPTGLALSATVNSVNGSFTGSIPAANKYMIVRTVGAALNTMPLDGVVYSGTIGNGTIIQSNASVSFSNGGLNPITLYRYTIIPYNETSCIGPVYNTSNLLTDSIYTQGARKYVWLPTSGSADYQIASNWNPHRTFTNINDTLVFNQGGQVTVMNIPSQSVAGIEIFNNSEITMTAAANDSITIGDYLKINYGTSLTLAGSNYFKLGFKNMAGERRSFIDGKLILTGNNKYNTRYSLTKVTGTVEVNHAQSFFYNDCISCYNDTIVFLANARLELSKDSSFIPAGVYDSTSTVYIKNIVNKGPTMASTPYATNLGHLIYDCPQAIVNMAIPGAVNQIKGNLIIKNSGTGYVSISNTYLFGQMQLWKGNFNIYSGVIFYKDVFLDTGKVSIYSSTGFRGNLTSTVNDTIQVYSTNTVVEFAGPGQNHVNILGQYIGGAQILLLNNPMGAEFTGNINLVGTDQLRIDQGSWTGTGIFNFGPNTKLIYNHDISHAVTTTEWPFVNGPNYVTVNLEAGAPNNRLYLPGDRTIAGTLEMNDGVVVLDNNSLSVNTIFQVGQVVTSNKMIATIGTGKLYINFPSGASTALYPLGDLSGTPNASPVVLSLAGNTNPRYIGIQVDDLTHPNVTGSNPLSRYWQIVDTTSNASYTYKLDLVADSSDVTSPNIGMQAWDGSSWQLYPSYFMNDSLRSPSLQNIVNYPLSRTFTGFLGGTMPAPIVYTWNGSVNHDYQQASNWTPTRTSPFYTDQLIFNDGLLDSIVNIPTQTIGRLSVLNQTNVLLVQNYLTLSLQSDNDSTTNELYIATGSSLKLKGNVNLINFNGLKNSALVEGRLELMNLFTTNKIDFTNSLTTIASQGTLASGGNTIGNPFVSDTNSLKVFGTYEHKYTTAPGFVPIASWKDGSNMAIIGALSFYLNNANNLVGFKQSFYDVTYNCPSQYSTTNPSFDTVRNQLKIISTGTSKWTGGVLKTKKVIQTGGKFEWLGTSEISDSVYQFGGTIFNSNQNFLTSIIFNGQNGQQVFNCHDSSFAGEFNYTIENPQGIYLTGSGILTSASNFRIYKNGGITIKTNVLQPINTNLVIKYDSVNTTLAYVNTGNVTADSICFPAVNGPANLTTDVGSLSKIILPFDRTIPSVLKMTSGNIDVQNYILTLGKAANSVGTLNYTSGYLLSTTGYFKRWYGTNLNTTNSIAFPLSDGQNNRLIYLKANVNNGVTTGGTLRARHQALSGISSGLNIIDGSFTITDQSNSIWEILPDNGLAVNTTLTIQAVTEGMNLGNNTTNLRLTNSNPANGIHVNTSGNIPFLIVERSGLSLSDLGAGPFKIGFNGIQPITSVYSVASGNWNNPNTWNINAVPTSLQNVTISAGDSVVMNSLESVYSIVISSGASFYLNSDSIHVDSLVLNNGKFIQNGGVLDIGPQGGGNRLCRNNDSIFIFNGTLRVNGGFVSLGEAFVQTGGSIIVDGNGNGINPNYTSPYLEVNYNYVNATGGTMQIIDPHTSNVDVFNGGGFGPGHTLILGDGLSATQGGSYGFSLYPAGSLGNLKIIGTPSVGNRRCQLRQTTNLYGNLTLMDSNAYLNMNGANLNIGGDLSLDTATTLISNGTLAFLNYNQTYQQLSVTPQSQTLNNFGLIQNLTSNPTATFNSLLINNGTSQGVKFNLGDFSYDGNLTMTNGKLAIGQNNTVTGLTANSASSTNGWLHGKLNMYLNNLYPSTHVFPVGDSLYASKVSFTLGLQATQTITAPGFISIQAITPDHPAIGSSTLDPLHSVNRYFHIDTSGGIKFSNGFAAFNLNYATQDLDPLANYANFIYARYSNGSWSNDVPITLTTTSLISFKDLNNLVGDYIIGENHVAPTIITQPINQSVCSGDATTFTVVSATTNQFQWQVNTGSGFVNLMNTTFYSGVNSSQLLISNTPAAYNGFQYRCLISNSYGNVYSASATLQVGTGVVPNISITSNAGNIICASDQVTFNASFLNGGANPSFEWYINNVPQGTNAPSIILSTLSNNDVISCKMISSSGCAIPVLATSNLITMTVNPLLTPSATITANPGSSICAGNAVTFTATPLNGGTSPVYQWKLNGTNVGTNNATYTNSSLSNGNTIYCVVTSNETCLATTNASSNTYTMNVSNPVAPSVTISSNLGTTVCDGAMVTFTATPVNGGSSSQYQWLKNGFPVGTNNSTYNDNALQNGDLVSCLLTSSLICVTQSYDTSNVLTMIVNPSVSPIATISVSPSDTICSGTIVNFTSSIQNPGSSVLYTWLKNNVSVSSSSAYSSSNISNGDIISLVINTSPLCANSNIDTSNEVIMVVNPTVTPSVSISATPGNTICVGDSVTYTATSQFGGNTPMYQWKKNNVIVGTNSQIYGDNSMVNGDVIICELISNALCTTTSNALSNSITMTTQPIVTPTINISSNPNGSICNGTLVNFTATITNGGFTPAYQWQVNGNNVGTNTNPFSTTTLNNGDKVACVLTSSQACVTQTNTKSDSLVMTILPNVLPTIVINANPGTSVSSGTQVTFTAVTTNPGSSPTYQWKVNSSNVGTNADTYITSVLQDGDLITCDLTSNELCALPTQVASNQLKMSIANSVDNFSSLFSDMSIYPNPSQGSITLEGQRKSAKVNKMSYEMMSVTGQTILQGEIQLTQHAFSSTLQFDEALSAGLYILKLHVGNESAYFRILLNREK